MVADGTAIHADTLRQLVVAGEAETIIIATGIAEIVVMAAERMIMDAAGMEIRAVTLRQLVAVGGTDKYYN